MDTTWTVNLDITRPESISEEEWVAKIPNYVNAWAQLNGTDVDDFEVISVVRDQVAEQRYPSYRNIGLVPYDIVVQGTAPYPPGRTERHEAELNAASARQTQESSSPKFAARWNMVLLGSSFIVVGGAVQSLIFGVPWWSGTLSLVAAFFIAREARP